MKNIDRKVKQRLIFNNDQTPGKDIKNTNINEKLEIWSKEICSICNRPCDIRKGCEELKCG